MAPSFSQNDSLKIDTQNKSLEASDEKSQDTRIVSEQKQHGVDVSVTAQSSPRPYDFAGLFLPLHKFFTKHELLRFITSVVKFAKFMGPGAIISVAYIDPDNYQTAISAGKLQYKLLFMILVSNVIAIYLQVCPEHAESTYSASILIR